MTSFQIVVRWFVGALVSCGALLAGDWGAPVVVQHQYKPVVTYQARLDGGYLVIRAQIEPGWHTFTMDNELRAAEALKGQMSLGVDGPTKIAAGAGVEIAGPWLQSAPQDFSKPDMRWYSWGYEGEAVFAAKAQGTGDGAVVALSGQACSETTCKNIDVDIPVPAGADDGADLGIGKLVAVRTAK